MRKLLMAGAVMAAVGCTSEPSAIRVPAHKMSEGAGDVHVEPAPSDPTTTTATEAATTTVTPTTTTTEPAPVTTTVYVAPVTTRRTTTTTVYEPPAPQGRTTGRGTEPPAGDFWYRLATCESGNGRGSANQFQFMGGTAEKVGYYPGASYEEQRAMAIDWASRIHPDEGTTAGWPECWWIAGGS